MIAENLQLWIAAGALAAIVLLLAYAYVRESENAKRARRFEKAIEDLNKEIYRLNKRIKEGESAFSAFSTSFRAQVYQDTRVEMKNLIESNTNGQLAPLRTSLDLLKSDVQNANASAKDAAANASALEEKVLSLEDRIKELIYTPAAATNIDEGRIVAMHRDGWSVDAIAKELRIGKGEVEFTLKFANMG